MPETLTITAPDDWHVHLRDGEVLKYTVPHVAQRFQRAIIMPNLVPPITQTHQAMAYRKRILAHADGSDFQPLMVLYLTDNTRPEDISNAQNAGVIACKLYPAGATTHSDSGVTNIERIFPALEQMQKSDLKLLIHGEVTDHDIDIFDREAVFIDRVLTRIIKQFPALKIVMEHITTKDAVDFVTAAGDSLAATITAHHLLFNRNHLLVGAVRPHYYCLPILKREHHRQSLLEVATSGDPKFFLGTDSAPHPKSKKETACGCAGCYTAFAGIELYAEAFEQINALHRLEAFASQHGPDFYGLPRNSNKITLEKTPWLVPSQFNFGDDTLIPLKAGEYIQWKLSSDCE